ncbi:putative ribonuclease H-like domain-containing protein [Tanacetum coccineum]|uniref:Ribonuclease H-like domain-containing protein n=1 Tax=Tanacetum coccineum TaxID=301880 RepID=A0ABQ5BNK6_9ASTR
MTAKRNQERVKNILLLAIPDEYLLKFHNVPDAKSLWAAIKSRFGGNDESKKMQRNVLKHQFENFTTAPNESLDKAYDRFQKLISQLEVHAAPVSREDINQKFLRSLPPSWSQIALIMRNKPDIDQTDINDLYNNLRVYEDEMKRSSSSTSNSQNLAFLSSENTSSTNEVSTASGNFGVNTAGGTNSSSQVSSTLGADEVVCSFFAQQTTSPPLDNEDLQQIDQDDLEELDIRWQVAMKGHFAKECKSGWNQGKRSYGDNGRRNATTNEPSSQALVAQDGLGGYDWSNDFDEPVNYALMAISSSSSSSSSDNEVQNCSKQCLESFKTLQKNFDSEREKHSRARLEIQGYELALESLESRILRHEKNELAWVRSSDEEITPANDRFSKADGYHVVPPPITGNFLTPRADISFAGLDEYAIRKKIIKSKTTELNTDTSKSKTSETVGKTNEVNIEKPKSVHESVVPKPYINRYKVIIEDWNSDDEDDVSEVNTVNPVKTNKTQTVKTQVDKIGQISRKEGIAFKKIKAYFVYKRVLTRTGLVNPDRPNGKRAVHTISTARPISTTRSFTPKIAQTGSAIRPIYPRMDNVRPRASYSPIKRSYYTKPAFRPKDLKQDVKTFRVQNMTTAGTRAVVNTGKGKMDTDLKKSRWVWRPKGNYLDHVSKDSGSFMLKKGNPEILLQDHAVVDSGCSSHMTGNKAYLSDYEDYNGGFVAFGSDPKGGTQDSYVAGSSGKDKEPTQEYILLPLHPHRTRILVEDVAPAAHEKPSESSPKDNDVQDSEDVADKEGQHQMTKDEQVLHDELEKMIAQEVVAKALDDATRQAFEEEKRNIASQNRAAQATSINKLSTGRSYVSTATTPYVSVASTPTGANAGESSFVYIGGKIPIDASTLPNVDLPIDPSIPNLEDDSDAFSNDGIFNGAYDDENVGAVADFNNMDDTINVSPIPTLRIHKDHPKDQILGDPKSAVQTRGKIQKASSTQQALVSYISKQNRTNHKDHQNCLLACFLSQEEPKNISQALQDESWVEAMQEELLQLKLQKEVYVHQPPGFVDPAHPNRVYKVIKALYGLHQAPKAWYETLSSFLIENGFRRCTIDKTLFIKKKKSDIMLVQVYVDDIIFGSTKKSMCTEFEDCMHKRFQMCSMGELTFFLGHQVKQQPDGIFISQDKYVASILTKFEFWSIRTATTPIESNKPLVKDEDVHVYRSMIGSLMHLIASRPDIMFAVCACARFQVTPKASHLNVVKRIFRRLISWQCKKQTIVANSTTEVEYVAAAYCCGQVLWIQNQMMDYGFNFMNINIHVDNESTISVIKNPVAHSRTKHIEIQFHFIRDCYEKRLIEVIKIHTDSNVADLFTKGFNSAPSPIPSPSIDVPDPEGSSGNHRGESSNDASLSGNEDGQEAKESSQTTYHTSQSLDEHKISKEDFSEEKGGYTGVCIPKQGRKSVKSFKGKPYVHKDPAFDDIDDFVDVDNTLDYMESEDAQDEGRISSVVLEEKENADKEVSTKAPVSTVKPNEGDEYTDQNEGKSVTQTAPTSTSTSTPTTPTPTVFGDDETIAQVLIIMSQNKEKLMKRKKEPLPRNVQKIKAKRGLKSEEIVLNQKRITELKRNFKPLVMMKEGVWWARKFKMEWEAEEIKPPSRNQLRNQMMTYLKHVRGKKHFDLKTKSFDEIQVLYEKIKRFDDSFIAISSAKDEKMIKEMNEQAADASKKRKMKSKKRKFTSKDDEELRLCLTIALDEDKEVDYEILDKNNRQRRYFSTLMAVLSILNRDDICAIYQLVMNKYQDETPEGFDKILWGDLIIMFNQSDSDEFWNVQQNWKIVSWKLHSSSGIHTIMTDEGLVIHMFVENKYPLRKEVLSQLIELKLETKEDSTMALELIKFVKKQIAELEPKDSDRDAEDP